ncbi:MAG: SCO family protein [Ginsengibacter sp.]
MNKKTLLAFTIALLLPVTGYLLVKYYSETAVRMPHRYFFDDIATVEKNGRSMNDTLWHHVKNITFTNQLGKKVSFNDLPGKIIVVDLFFTRCPTICPAMAKAMKKLQQSFRQNDTIVQFVSISIDPLHDSVVQLRNFANKHAVNPDSWWLLTGDKKEIYDFALHELKADVADSNVDTAFIHTENFFLLDKERIVRGWYNGLDSVAQAKLVKDIPLLMLEKDRKKTFGEFLKELFGRS